MRIEVANGEIVDKVTILWIKLQKIKDPAKLINIQCEYDILVEAMYAMGIREDSSDYQALLEVNSRLWEIEDNLRIKESQKAFDEEFIALARSVYYENDKRAEAKKHINLVTGSTVIEEKEYVNYKQA